MPPGREHGGGLPPRYQRFFQWLAVRAVATLSIRDLADYVNWLHERKLSPTSIARHIASLRVFFRYLQLEGVLVESQAELLGSQKLWERVPQVLLPAQVNRLFEMPKPGDVLLAARSGLAGTALRHGLPGFGDLEPEAVRLASRRRLLRLPRQRRQAADGAAGSEGRGGRAGVSRRGARPAGRAGFDAARVGPALLPRPPFAARAGLGAA